MLDFGSDIHRFNLVVWLQLESSQVVMVHVVAAATP